MRILKISVGGNRKSLSWATKLTTWNDFIEKLKTPVRSFETYSEYLAMPKTKQDELKDVGGFVAGELKDGRRKAENIIGRDIITLDLDNIPTGGTQLVLDKIITTGLTHCVYSTRKHDSNRPRLRVLLPLDRTCTADEYEPIARWVASQIGMEYCDPTTFEASRLMYYPSCCADGEYVYIVEEGIYVATVDYILGQYKNWHDISEWAEVPNANAIRVKLASKQAIPSEKEGIVGAFCKTYDVYKAIDTFLSDFYIPCDIQDRYTFMGGTTTGGAVVYGEGNFLYSHHATDPISGKLCNAYDLVRIHKFGELDSNARPETPTAKLPSSAEMRKLALNDPYINSVVVKERLDKVDNEFSSDCTEIATEGDVSLIRIDSEGKFVKTIANVICILDNDPNLRGRIAYDGFSDQGLVLGELPWDNKERKETKDKKARIWNDIDDAGLRMYIERVYGISNKDKIFDAISIHSHFNSFNAIKDMLLGLTWDGKNRLDTILIDYLGAEDTDYNRVVMRKTLIAAVARVMIPATKFDLMPILIGRQGIGKSTMLKHLGEPWYSESLGKFEGKDASEMLRGIWINEIGELNGFSKSESGNIKQFLSKTEDLYRVPFGRRTQSFPRKCIFIGTTNEEEFLRDTTGNRRFLPVKLDALKPTKDVFVDFKLEVPQIWAEAYHHWQLGEVLFLSGAVLDESVQRQEEHMETDSREGIVDEFIARKIPIDWYEKNISEHRTFWADEFNSCKTNLIQREKICAMEVLVECFGQDLRNINQRDTRLINNMLKKSSLTEKPAREYFGNYGRQRGYIISKI